MNDEILRVEDLSLSFGSKKIFQNISLTLFKNRVTALVGPSGCGKSSFLICLNRMIEQELNVSLSGEIFFKGEKFKNNEAEKLRRKIGLVYQKPTPFPFSINKNFQIPLSEYTLGNKLSWQERMQESLEWVGLWGEVKDRLDTPALTLSGGQQQRLCIARSLALNPEVLLMDEPCSALDPISSQTLEELIVKLKKRLTVVIVTHNLAQAVRISDNMAFFWWCNGAGCLMEEGTTEEFFAHPKTEQTRQYIQSETMRN